MSARPARVSGGRAAGPPRALEIGYLADHLDALPALARWHEQEWGLRSPDLSFEERVARIKQRAGRRQIPSAFIAILGGEAAGFACLVGHDMDTRMDLSPWVSSVLVAPEHRGRGIGTALVERVVEEAAGLGERALFLFTYDKEEFYARRGWSVFERSDYRGEPVVIMRRSLTA